MKIFGYIGMILGIVFLSGIAFIYYTEGAEAFSTKTVTIHEEKHLSVMEVSTILVHSGSVDVEVARGSQEGITVELNGEVNEKMKDAFVLNVTENNSTLQVDVEREYRPSFTVFAINKKTVVTVTIPDQLFKEIFVETTSGDIHVNDVSGEQMMLKASSGDITAKNIALKELTVQATSGDIEVNGIDAKQISAHTTSGDIDGVRIAGFTHLALEATSGDISLDTRETSFTLDFTATSGEGEVTIPDFLFAEKTEERIKGKKGEGGHSITVKTTSGDFYFQ